MATFSLDEEVAGDSSSEAISLYDEMSAVELKEAAKEKGIKGYSSMNKAELIEALKALDE